MGIKKTELIKMTCDRCGIETDQSHYKYEIKKIQSLKIELAGLSYGGDWGGSTIDYIKNKWYCNKCTQGLIDYLTLNNKT